MGLSLNVLFFQTLELVLQCSLCVSAATLLRLLSLLYLLTLLHKESTPLLQSSSHLLLMLFLNIFDTIALMYSNHHLLPMAFVNYICLAVSRNDKEFLLFIWDVVLKMFTVWDHVPQVSLSCWWHFSVP